MLNGLAPLVTRRQTRWLRIRYGNLAQLTDIGTFAAQVAAMEPVITIF
jgi:hypothetical protein